MSADLLEIRDKIKAVPPSDFDQLMRISRNAAQKAQDAYELLSKNEHAPRELMEALRLNITTFILTMEKFRESSCKRGTDVKQICEASLSIFQVLINSSEKSVQNIQKVVKL